jgi:carboxypeptidase Taq
LLLVAAGVWVVSGWIGGLTRRVAGEALRLSIAPVLAGALRDAGHALEPRRLHRMLTQVRPSANRIAADPVSYPLHVVLRFELETAMLSGRLAAADVPGAWRDGMRDLLGVEVAHDNAGPLQDDHWADGAFGYFPSYAVGALLAAQLWDALERQIGPQEHALGSGDLAPVKLWLREHVHRHGRLVDTPELVRRAAGGDLDAGSFLRRARVQAESAERLV